MTIFIILFICSYVAGSLNFSILLFKILGKGDPRKKFSGNAGATNVYRQAGILWAIVVFLLDMGRAIGVAVIAIHWITMEFVPLIGFGLILGNRFPCFHGFRGGKGVANYFGFTAALTPLTAFASGCAWLIGYAIFRAPFISSFCMVIILAAGTLVFYNSDPLSIAGVVLTAAFIFFSHRQNIVEWVRARHSA